MQADDIQDALENLREDKYDPDIKALVKAVNMAANELASSGFPILRTDERVADDRGFIEIAALNEPPIAVREVRMDGERVPFALDGLHIVVGRRGKCEIVYAVAHRALTIDDPVEFGALVDSAVAEYLAARNYCLITGRTDEARIWDQLYASHTEPRRLTRRAKLPKRVWR